MKKNTSQLLNSAILETLEGRQMMSASPLGTASLRSGVLSVNSNSNQDSRVSVDLQKNSKQLTVDISGQRSTFAVSEVSKLNITTGSGADYIYVNPAIDIPENISSGNGNDTVRGGGGNVIITAGNGNDNLAGKGNNNVIQAGSGNDLLSGDKANNTLIAGNGNDTLFSGGRTDKLTVGNGNDSINVGDDRDTITMGTGHDTTVGGSKNTYVYSKPTTTTTTKAGGSTTTAKSGTTSGSTSGSTSSGTKPSTGTTSTASTTGSTGKTATVPTKPSPPPVTPVSPVSPTSPVIPTSPVTTSSGSGVSTGVKPTAVITELAGPRFAGLVVNVEALSSTLNAGTPITSNYEWNFGDPNGTNNQMTGFNAAHVYDTAGTFTITLTVTNSTGGIGITTQTVTVAAAQRKAIYVDPSGGSDSNNGSENAPLQSLAAAFAKLGNNTEILLRAGQTFNTNESNHVNFTNVLIGSYGTGANPVIMRSLGNGLSTIASFSDTNGLTIENITVNSPYAATTVAAANKIGLGGFFLGGQNICIRNCTFENVDDAINENGNPVGVLIQDNSAPLAIGLRGYMVWGQGSEQVIIGNYAANTTKEHIVRLVGLDMVNVQQNNFTNHDGKGCIEMHEGQYGWIVDNTVDGGDIRVGPLGLWGEAASSQTDNVKIEDNTLTNTFIYVQSGTHNAMIDNNVIIRAGGGQAIEISGVDSQGRTSMNITIENNTAIDTGTTGNFLDVGGYASGIVLKDNLWVAPKLTVGSYGAAPVYVDDSNLGCFTQISGNVWPSPITLGTYANGGINFVGTSMSSSGYLSAAQWNAQSNVGTDLFENVSLNGSYQVHADSLVAGAAMLIAA